MSWLRQSLLHQAQLVHPCFPHDSKHLVDMPVKASSSLVAMLTGWQELEQQRAPVSREQLQHFVSQHFDDPGSDIEPADAAAWEDRVPDFLPRVEPAGVREFGGRVSSLWKILYRKVSDDVLAHPENHTILPLPHPFVIPGDRFREVYYWDSYWIILGLLACGLRSTAVGMVHNLLSMVDTFGHVPNGSRTYYINRSQPPLLSAMVSACHAATAAVDAGAAEELLRQALPRLLLTWSYWTSGDKALSVAAAEGEGGVNSTAAAAGAAAGAAAAAGSCHRLSRYYADWDHPRPESYREDVVLAQGLRAYAARVLYRELASCAESGWDFSSRWFADGQTMASIRTTQIIPVDLNAFLLLTARHIAAFAEQLGDVPTAAAFNSHASALKAAMNQLMWDEASGCWHDLLLVSQDPPQPGSAAGGGEQADGPGPSSAGAAGGGAVWKVEKLRRTYASNWVPLWCGACEPGSAQARAAVQGFVRSGLIQEAGVLTSLYETGQQWDAPNAFPPLQHMLIQGLRDSGTDEGAALAARLAAAWVQTNLRGFEESGHMHEKYDAVRRGVAGGGGEYRPQVGFGWTNGVLLELLRMYPDQSGAGVGRVQEEAQAGAGGGA